MSDDALMHVAEDHQGEIIVLVDWEGFDAEERTWESLRKAFSYGTFLRTENERFYRAAKPNAQNSIDNLIMAGNFRSSSSVRELHLESANYSSTTTYVGYTAAEVQFTRNTG